MKKALSLVLALVLILSVSAAFAEKTQLTLWSIAVDSDAATNIFLIEGFFCFIFFLPFFIKYEMFY